VDCEQLLALQGEEFIKTLTDKYLAIIGNTINVETMAVLNGYQHTLLAYRYFCEEVKSGGFVQLIQNGYGTYIFRNPFAKTLKTFGAENLSKLVYKAQNIYFEHAEELEKETTEEQFLAMYVDFEDFDEIEEAFFEIEEEQTALIVNHVKQNRPLFL
jgi:hypothetical protein